MARASALFTRHPAETENPQSYWAHGFFAARNSARLLLAALAGLVHAVFPFLFPFYTSTTVIKTYQGLVDSRRHKAEIERYRSEPGRSADLSA